MSEIRLTNMTKRWGKFYAMDHLDLLIKDSSSITLLGPSGHGKTTTLHMIAGLETSTSGQIKIGDRVVFDSEAGINVPTGKRKTGFLFQNYALWPNMTVYQNIFFGLNSIREEVTQCDFEARTIDDLIQALQNGKRIAELVEGCRDKKNKLDMDKVYLKFINACMTSICTAKTSSKYRIQESSNPDGTARSKAAEPRKKLVSIKGSYKAEDREPNEGFEITSGDEVLMENRKLHKRKVGQAVRRVARIVKIGPFISRYPVEPSGRQQQHVVIVRTLVSKPIALFVDKPLSNLDVKPRLEMRYELQRLHVETGSIFVYVTHDQMGVMTLATKTCLISNGVFQQYDAPLEVYHKPSNLFVADFVGNPSINFIEARGKQVADKFMELTILDGVKVVFHPTKDLDLKRWLEERNKEGVKAESTRQEVLKSKRAVEKGSEDEWFKYHTAKVDENDHSIEEKLEITDRDFTIGVRLEYLKFGKEGKLHFAIYDAIPTDMKLTMKLRIGEYLLTGIVFGGVAYRIGEEINTNIQGEDILLYDRKSGRCIASDSLEML